MSEEIKDKFYERLSDNLKPYYEKGDCCSWMVELRKDKADLQQKVEQLEKENKELRDENKRIFQNVNDDELLISNAMNYAELKKAEKRLGQLENIRKEAIDYINKNWGHWCSNHCKYATETINILNKGSDK